MKQRQAFDDYANAYDAHFTHSNIGRIQRKQVWKHLEGLLQQEKHILELNCGTGEDAIKLAELGHSIIATDISEEMIKVGVSKKKSSDKWPVFKVAHFLEIEEQVGGHQFDLVFSNFGGMNCLSPDEMKMLIEKLHSLLKPGGQLFLVLISQNCWWEQLYYRYKGEMNKARRRHRQGPVSAKIGQTFINLWYYTPKQLQEMALPLFKFEAIAPIGLAVPPSYMEAYFHRKPLWLKFLERLDSWVSPSYLANAADHFVIRFKK